MFRYFLALAVVAAPAMAQEPLGPGGLPAIEPFPLNAEYENDYKLSNKCKDTPEDGGVVSMGNKAIYYKRPDGKVDVLVNEFARRFGLDYCWI